MAFSSEVDREIENLSTGLIAGDFGVVVRAIDIKEMLDSEGDLAIYLEVTLDPPEDGVAWPQDAVTRLRSWVQEFVRGMSFTGTVYLILNEPADERSEEEDSDPNEEDEQLEFFEA